MYAKLRPTTASALAAALIADIAAGAGNATVAFFTGTPPASPATAPGSTLLGTLTCSATPATQVDGTITFNTITQDSGADASASETPLWARICDGDGAGVLDVDVSDGAGTGAVKLNTTTIVAGGPIALTSLVIVIGG